MKNSSGSSAAANANAAASSGGSVTAKVAREAVGKHPYLKRPLCGLYTLEHRLDVHDAHFLRDLTSCTKTLLPHRDSTLHFTVTHRSTHFHVSSKYDFSPAPRGEHKDPHVVLFFPYSECGAGTDQLDVRVNGVPLLGQLVRCDPDGTLAALPATHEATPSPSRQRQLYYYVVSDVLAGLGPKVPAASAAATLSTAVSWRCCEDEYRAKTQQRCAEGAEASKLAMKAWLAKESKDVAFSLYCSPAFLSSIQCDAQFPAETKVRVVRCPNGPVEVQRDRLLGSSRMRITARLLPAATGETPPDDYLFLLQFFFGELPIDEGDEVDGTAQQGPLVALIIAVALIVWFLLTKDLAL